MPFSLAYGIIIKFQQQGGFLVGEILRKRREELGRDLREISDVLKIRYDYLKALEDEAFGRLPEEIYVKGYIREYAALLKIDPELPLKAYLQQMAPAADNEEAAEPEIPERKKVKIRFFVVPSLLALAAIIVIVFFSPFSVKEKELTQLPSGDVKESSPSETKNMLSSSSVEQEKLPEVSKETPEKMIPDAEKTSHILEVFAEDITWLSVTADEAEPREMLMNPGEFVKLKATKCFSMRIGNAGGVNLVFDGKELGKLGEKGQVIELNLPDART